MSSLIKNVFGILRRTLQPNRARSAAHRGCAVRRTLAAVLLAAGLMPLATGCDEYEQLVAQHGATADEDILGPWEMFCLVTSDAGEETAKCLDGQP